MLTFRVDFMKCANKHLVVGYFCWTIEKFSGRLMFVTFMSSLRDFMTSVLLPIALDTFNIDALKQFQKKEK